MSSVFLDRNQNYNKVSTSA